MSRSRVDAILSMFVTVHPHETSALLHSSACFFFILCAYFVVLPLRDEGAISLGLSNLPSLFIGSLLLTSVAAPLATLFFSLPNVPKSKALVLMHRFFSVSLVVFFVLWHASSAGYSQSQLKGVASASVSEREGDVVNQASTAHPIGWEHLDWFYVSVRIGLFLWMLSEITSAYLETTRSRNVGFLLYVFGINYYARDVCYLVPVSTFVSLFKQRTIANIKLRK